MNSIFDEYMKHNIMSKCEEFFFDYLAEAGLKDEYLTEEDREIVAKHIEFLMDMASEIHMEFKDDDEGAYDALVDKLVGTCVINKMNEVRLCRLLSERNDQDGDV